jgi:beta-N-acetylhexosaminidase
LRLIGVSGSQRARSAPRIAAIIVAAASVVGANCADDGKSINSVVGAPVESNPGSIETQSSPATSVSSTHPAASTSTSTTSTTSTISTSSTTSARPSVADAELLAGARVLCTFKGAVVPKSVIARLLAGQAAGVLLFSANLVSQQQALANAEEIQAAATASPSGAPAIIATDQEGGIVHRVPGPPTESAADMGTRPVAEIEEQGKATAENLVAWGINTDFAPVADVVRPSSFEERQHRSFSSDPRVAAAAVSAFVNGLHEGGVVATLKHFPGLGAAAANTDDAAASVAISADDFNAVDVLPFTAGIAAGADLVMVSSATYPSLDVSPAVLSSILVGGELRERLGFTGVVVSDALDTPAVASLGSPAEVAVRAALAGVDLFIVGGAQGCVDIQAALAKALVDGELPIEQAQAAEARLHALRSRLASVPVPGP